eukprot:CAMPEP_0172925350 /NCGR_PEP_ID=MMETSP1075-20121228/213557_1 /TAXON_ID=2916 /ORGANISM="Ceratium fusus, Strain PA161109" /LENGTH=609 /DNA_ID=CAMNT_0013786225 /DNA_START=48 /DNA_END=1873 /DNA_ORIENTATION=+
MGPCPSISNADKDTEALQWINWLRAADPSAVPDIVRAAPPQLRAHRNFVLTAAKKWGLVLLLADDRLKDDPEIVLAAVESDGSVLKFAGDRLKASRAIVLAAVRRNGHALEYADKNLYTDREIVHTAMQTMGVKSGTSRAVEELVTASIQRHGSQKSSASKVGNVISNDTGSKLSSVGPKDENKLMRQARGNGSIRKLAEPQLPMPPQEVHSRAPVVGRRRSAACQASKGWPKSTELPRPSEETARDPLWDGPSVRGHDKSARAKELVLAQSSASVTPAAQNNESSFAEEEEQLLPLWGDRNFVLSAVKVCGYALEQADEELRADHEIVLEAIRESGYAFSFASRNLKVDRDFVLQAVRANGNALLSADDGLKKDREIVVAAVKQCGHALHYADRSFSDDPEIVNLAIGNIGIDLSGNETERELFLRAVQTDGHFLKFATEALKADQAIVLSAVQQNGWSLQHAADNLKANPGVVLAAVQQRANTKSKASETKASMASWAAMWRMVIGLAGHGDDDAVGDVFKYADDSLKSCREFVLTVVGINGEALHYADSRFFADREIVHTAMRTMGVELYGNETERQVLVKAVQKDGNNLHFASEELRADKEIVLA